MSKRFLPTLVATGLLITGASYADVFTNVPEAAGYQLVYSLDVPEIQGNYNTGTIPYSVNNAGNYPAGTFTRVAYYIELTGSTDPTRKNGYVFVSFDRPAPLLNGFSLGVPSNGPNGSKVVTNTSVTHMNVVSNIQGVITGNDLPGGKLEFWPSGYTEGANGVFDYDDSSFNGSTGHGSMQIHNAAAGQTLFAYNDWGGNTPGTPSEIGAGPNPGAGSPDWTFSNSASAYTVRSIQVLVKAASNLVPIVNPSFDAQTITGPYNPAVQFLTTGPTGWTYTGTPLQQGLIAPNAGEPNSFYNGFTTGYSGTNAHFAGNNTNLSIPTLSQTLTTTLQANTTYTLSMQLGNRTNGDPWAGQHITLKAGSAIVGEWVGGNQELTPDNTFARTARKFTTGANPPGLGQPLQIIIEQARAVASQYLDVDDVVLTADPAPVRPVGTPIDVMIVAGQSNAQGWQGNVNALNVGNRHYVDSPSMNAFISYKQNAYGQPVYISGSMGQLSQLGAGFAGPWEGFGPELSLGTDLAGRLSNKVAVIKFASGGAGLNGQFKKSVNDLYPLLIAQVNSGMAQLTAQGFTPTIKGFFWLQGESDAIITADAPLYGANMTQFLSDLRTDLNAPAMKAILTEINPNMPALQPQPTAGGVTLVNAGLQAAVASDPLKNSYVTTADMTAGFGDTIHYAANQLITIGQRWANAYQAAPPATPGQTVFDRVPEASAEGYQVLYELNMPLDGGFRGTTPVPYTTDNSLTALPYDRVAYYMELGKADGTTQWVYASMDAFSNVAKQLGIPHPTFNPVKFQQPVTNMNVYSNVAGLATGTSLEGGAVEMWPSGYLGSRGGGFYAGNRSIYDWDDGGGTTDAGYGSFQVHNPLSRQVVLAYNHWCDGEGNADDVGIGNQGSGHPDWTFSGNAGNYTVRRLVILTRPGLHVTFTAAPKSHALYPRDRTTNKATVAITGVEREGGFAKAILRTYRNGVFQTETAETLTYAGLVAPILFNPEIPAELAGYDFEVLLEKADGSRRMVHRATDVVAGDAYLFYGQSNTEAGQSFSANNQSSSAYAGPWVRTFGQNADSGNATRNNVSWVPADGDAANLEIFNGTFVSDGGQPGAVGQWAIVIGGKIVADQHIPVALLNGARGGASITQLQKDRAQPNNLDDDAAVTRWYNRMRYRAIQGGIASKARAMFYYQGESDADNDTVHTAGFTALVADWQTDYPALEHIYVTQLHVGCLTTRENVALRQAQRNFGDTFPNTSVMATNGLQSHDSCHYKFIDGYEKLGLYHYGEIARDLYNAPATPNLDALNPGVVAFADDSLTRIRVTMRDPGATINFPGGALQDFALTGTGAGITGATVSGNSFVLQLNGPASGSPVLEYRGHMYGGDFVTNGNGIGLLTFSEAVLPYAPVVSILSPASSQESSAGTNLNIVANAADGPNGPAVRMVFLVNGVQQFETTGNALNTTWTVPSNGAHKLVVRAYDADGRAGTDSVTILAGANSSPGGVTNGLAIWFKSEMGITKDPSGKVLSWMDQSGNNVLATQSSAANQPTYLDDAFGVAAGVQFDGNDALTSTGGMPTGSYTKIVRFKAITNGTNHNLISSDVQHVNAPYDHAFYLPGMKPTIFHSGRQISASQSIASGASTVAACSYDSTNGAAKVYVGGTLQGSGTIDGPNTVASFQLGSYFNSNYLTGAIAEVIVYNRVLNDSELAAVNSYLDDKYRTPFELWLKNYYGQAGPLTADTDSDGISTLVEYALGLDPTTSNANSPRLPQVTRTGNNLEVTYQRATDRPDIVVRLASSPDLINWTLVNDSPVNTAGNLETRHYTTTIAPDKPKLFYHLVVDRP